MRRSARQLLLVLRLLVLALVGCLGTTLPAYAAEPASGPHLVVLGAAGLRWADLSPGTTPALWGLADRSALASLVTRSAGPVTCPADGWLTVGVGARAQALRRTGPASSPDRCPTSPPSLDAAGGSVSVHGWPDVLDLARHASYAVHPGLLGQQLDAHGCATAVGPGAALALALPDGSVPRYRGSVHELTADDVRACAVTVVDLDAGAAPAAGVSAGLRRLDAGAAEALAAARAARGDVLLLGLSGDARGGLPHLGVAAEATAGSAASGTAGGPASGHWLTSRSTRRRALVQLPDVTASVLGHAGVAVPADVVGSPLTVGSTRPPLPAAVQRLVHFDSDERTTRQSQAPFWVALVVGELVVFGGAWAVGSGGGQRRYMSLRTARLAGLVGGALPLATFVADLLPWPRAPLPVLALLAISLLVAYAVAALSVAGPWRRRLLGPIAVVGGTTAAVLGVDVLLGARLQEGSLMGYFATVAGRFYGFGNQAFSLFATGALLGAAGLAALLRRHGCSPLVAGAAVVAVGLAAVAVDGAPWWGADVGGVLATVPAFTLLALRVAGARVSPLRLGLALGAAVGALAVLAAVDAARPPGARTHLGRFAVGLLHGEAGQTVRRKLAANLGILVASPVALLLPLALLIIGLVLAQPTRWHAPGLAAAYAREPLLRSVLGAFLVLQVLAVLLNDSGVAMPAVALLLLLPLLVADGAQALLTAPAEAPAAAVPAGR